MTAGQALEVEEMGEPPLTRPQTRALRLLAAHDGDKIEVAGATSESMLTVHRVSFARLRGYGLADFLWPDDPCDWRVEITAKGLARVAADRERTR